MHFSIHTQVLINLSLQREYTDKKRKNSQHLISIPIQQKDTYVS